jgi:hypothetical protein
MTFERQGPLDSFRFETQYANRPSSCHPCRTKFLVVNSSWKTSHSVVIAPGNQTMGRGMPEHMSLGDFLPGLLAVLGSVLMFLAMEWCFRKLRHSIMPEEAEPILSPPTGAEVPGDQASGASGSGLANQQASLSVINQQKVPKRILMLPLTRPTSHGKGERRGCRRSKAHARTQTGRHTLGVF